MLNSLSHGADVADMHDDVRTKDANFEKQHALSFTKAENLVTPEFLDLLSGGFFCGGSGSVLWLISPLCSSSSVCLLQFCSTAQQINFHTSFLDSLIIQNLLGIAIGSVDIHFQFKTFLLKYSINNAVCYLVATWNHILKCDAYHLLKTRIINDGCWSTTTDNPMDNSVCNISLEPQKSKTFSQWKQFTFPSPITLLLSSSALKPKWSQFTINRFIIFDLGLIFDIKT